MRDKLEFILCIVIAVCFVVALGALIGMSFSSGGAMFGKIVIGALLAAVPCAGVLIGCLLLDATGRQA
jgi:hypothetical protein